MCIRQSKFDFSGGKLPISMFSLFWVPFFLLILMFQSVQRDAFMTGVSSTFPENPLCSSFWIKLFRLRPVDPTIGLTAISTLGMASLSIVIKTESWIWFKMVVATSSTSLPILLPLFLSLTRLWLVPFPHGVALAELSTEPSFCVPTFLLQGMVAGVLPPITKTLKDSFICRRSFLFCWFLACRNHVNIDKWIEFDFVKSKVIEKIEIWNTFSKRTFVNFASAKFFYSSWK